MLILPSCYWNCCTSEFLKYRLFLCLSILLWSIFVCRPDGSWWAQCLTAVLEPEWPSARLTSARSGTSARAPATWPTACDRQPTYYQVTARSPSQVYRCTSTQHNAHGQLRMGEGGWGWGVVEGHHCLNMSLKQIQLEVQFAHGGGGILGRFYWLGSAHLTNLKSSLTKCHI